MDDETDYDVEMDRAAQAAEARLEDEDAAFVAQLEDMLDARGLPWVLMALARLERRTLREGVDDRWPPP